MFPRTYGRYLYLKNKEKLDLIIAKHGFQIPEEERETFVAKLYEDFWFKMGFMVRHNIEFKWGWKYVKGNRRTLRHPFQITYSRWKKKKV